MTVGSTCDAVVIGGGFYGCETALELARLGLDRIILVEQEPHLLRRASFVNQARVHSGYHYPRAHATALRSRKNYDRFVGEYGYAVTQGMEHYYVIAAGSRVTANQYQFFCDQVGAVCHPAPREIELLFERGTIERVFQVEELAFDATKIAQNLSEQLSAANIDIRCSKVARVAGTTDQVVHVDVSGQRETARWVFNCTYASIETVGVTIKSSIKKELAEMVLFRPPPQLRERGFTVMDGPFFSTMPFPAAGLHSLSHVRYTPHEASTDISGSHASPTRSHGVAMLRDASRYMPCLSRVHIEQSIFEIKAVLQSTENDDARPILIERSPDSERIVSLLGAKIDNIYEVREYLQSQQWR